MTRVGGGVGGVAEATTTGRVSLLAIGIGWDGKVAGATTTGGVVEATVTGDGEFSTIGAAGGAEVMVGNGGGANGSRRIGAVLAIIGSGMSFLSIAPNARIQSL